MITINLFDFGVVIHATTDSERKALVDLTPAFKADNNLPIIALGSEVEVKDYRTPQVSLADKPVTRFSRNSELVNTKPKQN